MEDFARQNSQVVTFNLWSDTSGLEHRKSEGGGGHIVRYETKGSVVVRRLFAIYKTDQHKGTARDIRSETRKRKMEKKTDIRENKANAAWSIVGTKER